MTSVSRTQRWRTPVGLEVTRCSHVLGPQEADEALARLETSLDERRGLLLSGRHDQPGRYRPHDVGYCDPPVQLTVRGGSVEPAALNARGHVLLPALAAALRPAAGRRAPGAWGRPVAEEDRTRRSGVFGALRALVTALRSPQDELWGLYGAFGYDLAFDVEPVPLHQDRDPRDRTMVLHLPDVLLHIDRRSGQAVRHSYEFCWNGARTDGLPRRTPDARQVAGAEPAHRHDHAPGEYAELVRAARERFRAGDLFEVVPGQSFHRPMSAAPSQVFRRLRERNPAPYGLLANLGEGEHLVGASPEMFVRVGRGGEYVESCPISGTIARGRDALEDARQVLDLLSSRKEESELTMCTDVDRNDKARICRPGSVEVVARRQIERYSTLIHTVDHVRGRLRADRDALDAFVSHMWAVTVTGAPKRAAIVFVEEHERSPRRWYGGAVGRIGFDGGLETALTLRTVQVRDGVATVRAGATLLFDSDPDAEEAETLLKAMALLDAVEHPAGPAAPCGRPLPVPPPEPSRRVLLVDHQDSFVHNLADYLRQTGAEVVTYRAGFPPGRIEELRPDLLVLSPGPGRPADFGMSRLIGTAVRLGVPVFGVCLGLQGIVEHFGGTLATLPVPVHGKPSRIDLTDGGGALFDGVATPVRAGRYHSLYVAPAAVPEDFTVTAVASDGTVMALEHRDLPIAAVQFHPESIMSTEEGTGHRIVANAVRCLTAKVPANVGSRP